MLDDWHDFYLLIGGAAGALIGLLFVVVSLTAGGALEQTDQGRRLFTSPVVSHLSVILGIGGLAMAPHPDPLVSGLIVLAVGLGGLAYMGWATWTFYFGKDTQVPHWTDPWCYAVFPGLCYAGVAVSGVVIALNGGPGLVLLAMSVGALLTISIRNAWDLITWIAPRARPGAKPDPSGADGVG